MNPRRKSRLYLAIVVLIGIALTATLMLYALRSNIDLFYTPGEILQGKGENHEKPEVGQRLRIGGMVMPGSVKRDPNTLQVSFKIYDARGAIGRGGLERGRHDEGACLGGRDLSGVARTGHEGQFIGAGAVQRREP